MLTHCTRTVLLFLLSEFVLDAWIFVLRKYNACDITVCCEKSCQQCYIIKASPYLPAERFHSFLCLVSICLTPVVSIVSHQWRCTCKYLIFLLYSSKDNTCLFSFHKIIMSNIILSKQIMTQIMGECMCKEKVKCVPNKINKRVQEVSIKIAGVKSISILVEIFFFYKKMDLHPLSSNLLA